MMRSMIKPLLFLLFLFLGQSCEKENYNIEGRLENEVAIAPLMYDAFIEESDNSFQVQDQLMVEEFAQRNITSVGTISQGQAGPVLYLGIGKFPPDQFHQEAFPFSLKFRVDELDPTIVPTENDLRDYFSIGRDFPFGEANGEVQFGILLPGGTPDDLRSRSDYVASPEGTVRVEKIEPFIAPFPENEGGQKTYQMITFSFAGRIGIHSFADEQEAEWLRIPYVASSKAWVTGTATLVLAATPR